MPDTAPVVAAVMAAKEDETYSRKLHRAVLIAWARGANVGTEGLRWAFGQYYDAEERSCQSLVNGTRFEDPEPDLRFGSGVNRALAAARLGLSATSDDLGLIEKETGDVVRAAFWRSGQRDLLPVGHRGTTLGLAELRNDGTWRLTHLGEELWDAMALAPERKIARTATRQELEAALPLSRSTLPAHGFTPSDLVTACGVPKQILWMRKWYGKNWWRRA